MAVDLSSSLFELFAGTKRTRVLPTLAIAVIATAVVAVPLIFVALDPEGDDGVVLAPADAGLILVDTIDSDPVPLDLASVSGDVLISIRDEAASAAAFNLFSAGADDPIVESQDLEGPQFDLIVSSSGGGTPFDTAQLPNGDYELFVTLQTGSETRRTAVSFMVENP